MRTVLTKDPAEAAEFIRSGRLAAFPTETVYGLGANMFDAAAVARIFEAKMRPADNPLIAHVASVAGIRELTKEVTESAERFIARFFPGPLTVVLRKSEKVPLIATAGLDTIGVRMPQFTAAHAFLEACGVPVVAPSANLSGRPSPTTWEAVQEDLGGRIDCILQGDATEIGLESTVVDCTGDVPVLLRSGAVSLADLQAVVPGTVMFSADIGDVARSPGLRHRHYSPRATVRIVRDLEFPLENGDAHASAFIGLGKPSFPTVLSKIFSTTEEYAHSIFEFFRECDRVGVRTIYCEAVEESGIGAALMDRLRRAEAG